jgi:hypothetical protein
MNKIVRELLPASDLPPRYRGAFDPGSRVMITIEEVPSPPTREALIQMIESAHRLPPAEDDSVERIRKLRDEWDE